MKRVIRAAWSTAEPSAAELGRAHEQADRRMNDRYEPFDVKEAYLDQWSINKISYRITLDDNEFIAWYDDVDRYADKSWQLFGIFNPGQVRDDSLLVPRNLYTDEKFKNIDSIVTFLFNHIDEIEEVY